MQQVRASAANYNIFLFSMYITALTLVVWQQKGHPAGKKSCFNSLFAIYEMLSFVLWIVKCIAQFIPSFYEVILRVCPVNCGHYDLLLRYIWTLCQLWLFRFSSLPSVIYQFKRLEILMANDNQIGDINADSLCQMPMIATLALQNNNISTVPPQLGNCSQLRFYLVILMKFNSIMNESYEATVFARIKVKSPFQATRAHRAALISVSLAIARHHGHSTSALLCWYQFILLGDRGNSMWETCSGNQATSQTHIYETLIRCLPVAPPCHHLLTILKFCEWCANNVMAWWLLVMSYMETIKDVWPNGWHYIWLCLQFQGCIMWQFIWKLCMALAVGTFLTRKLHCELHEKCSLYSVSSKSFVSHMDPQDDSDLHFFSPQSYSTLHCETWPV